MTTDKALKYQLQERIVKDIRDDERKKALEEVEKMIDKLQDSYFTKLEAYDVLEELKQKLKEKKQ